MEKKIFRTVKVRKRIGRLIPLRMIKKYGGKIKVRIVEIQR
jgi:hypothetical protein